MQFEQITVVNEREREREREVGATWCIPTQILNRKVWKNASYVSFHKMKIYFSFISDLNIHCFIFILVLKQPNCSSWFTICLTLTLKRTFPLSSHSNKNLSDKVDHVPCRYSVMAGTPEKMLEHLLETRLDNTKSEETTGSHSLLNTSNPILWSHFNLWRSEVMDNQNFTGLQITKILLVHGDIISCIACLICYKSHINSK